MPLVPNKTDPNYEKEVKRAKEDPVSFGPDIAPIDSKLPKGYNPNPPLVDPLAKDKEKAAQQANQSVLAEVKEWAKKVFAEAKTVEEAIAQLPAKAEKEFAVAFNALKEVATEAKHSAFIEALVKLEGDK